MVDVKKLREQELSELNKTENVILQEEEYSLEELILLGKDKKIPIIIEYPLPDGRQVKSKALIKQLTINELDNVKVTNTNALQTGMLILQKALFKQDGENFKRSELGVLPIGVVNAIAEKILEISGVDEQTGIDLSNF